jgi:outer membrane receptor for ferrienterochelin and colicin
MKGRVRGSVLVPLAGALILLFSPDARAGTNGILEGFVHDKANGDPLPGATVFIPDANLGTTTDAEGRYAIHNVRAGRYDVRFSLIGYQTSLIRNVVINPDLRTRLTIELEATDVLLEEITVVREKPLIQKDVTGTTYIISSEELQALPVDDVTDVLGLKAGVTLEGNVRGGKSTEVVYLVDGLPVQDVIAGGQGSTLPKSSVVGVSIYTGGFEPEYGNALSGVVNIVTRSGSNEHHLLARADNDHAFGGTQNSRTSEVELSASGPLVSDRMFYVVSGNAGFSDTRWWQDFDNFFDGPIEQGVSGFGKVDYHFTPTLRLGAQVLYSFRDWHPYEFNWRFNLSGLPPEEQTSHRVAAILSHTVSEEFFYTASLSRFWHRANLGAGEKEDLPLNDPYQYDFFLRYIVDGQRAWWSETTQESYTTRFDGTFKAAAGHLLKFGGEATFYDLTSEIVKFEPQKTYFGKPLLNEPQLDFSTAYDYGPRSAALYVNDKIDLPSEGILLNLGVRYDLLDPRASRPNIEAIPVADSSYFSVSGEPVKASAKHQLSPRLGAAMQITDKGYLFVNLGWYFQYPLFEYLYTGLDRVALAKGLSALTGNPDLEPERTRSYELSVRYSLIENLVGSVTYFRKETTDQVDSKTFVAGDSKAGGSFGFAEYVNNPYADVEGIELVLARESGEWVTGELSYTVMRAEGLSGSADDGFFLSQYGFPPAIRIYPLSWDQTHSLKLNTTVLTPWDTRVNMVIQWHSGRPYTNFPTQTGFEPVEDPGDFQPNNERMPSYTNIDLRIAQPFHLAITAGSVLTVYLDVRNLLNEQNVSWLDSNGRIGGELNDPSGYFIGRRTSLGLQMEL